jgi:hypothetical protein
MTKTPNVARPSDRFSGAIEIELNHGLRAIIDAADYPLVAPYRWFASRVPKFRSWYAAARIEGKFIRMHRFLTGAAPGTQIDHRHGNGLDNRRCEIRFCTPSQNMANRAAALSSKTGLKGVICGADRDSFQAAIQKNRRRHYLGSFPTAELAHAAYVAAAKEIHGEFAHA